MSYKTQLLVMALLSVAISVSAFASSTGNRSLGFGIYTTNSSFLTAYKGFYKNATGADILMDDDYNPILGTFRNYLAYWNTPQVFPRLLYSDSVSGISGTLRLAGEYHFAAKDMIDYDAESWSSTPIAEQNNQPYYVQQACEQVHEAGYNFSYSPELQGATGSQLANINWSCIDVFDIQEQAFSNNVQALVRNTTHMISISQGENPNLRIYIQLYMPDGTAQLQTDIAALANVSGVDGIILTCMPSCSQASLSTLVGNIKSYTYSTNQTALEISALGSSGFTNITFSGNITTISPATVFSAFDTQLGKNVSVFAFPTGVQYGHWLNGVPWTFTYTENGTVVTGLLNVTNSTYYPGRQDNLTNQINWKEIIPIPASAQPATPLPAIIVSIIKRYF